MDGFGSMGEFLKAVTAAEGGAVDPRLRAAPPPPPFTEEQVRQLESLAGALDPDGARLRGFRAWLATRPESVRRLAAEFPPGVRLEVGGRALHVLGYTEDDSLIVTPVDPAADYDAARAAQTYLCASHVRGGKDVTPEQRAEALVVCVAFMDAARHVDVSRMELLIATAIREAEEAVRRKGHGPGFSQVVAGARPLAAILIEAVRDNTPDRTGYGIENIVATNIAAFVATEREAERERCAKVVERYEHRCRLCAGHDYHETCEPPDLLAVAREVRGGERASG